MEPSKNSNKMSVTFETGDIFATPGIYAFAHGCNCTGAMGKGIALVFREKWPRMYHEYRRLCKSGGFKLGDVFTWEEEGQVIFNLGTQTSWTTKAELWAIEKSVKTMIKNAVEQKIKQIALPRIGAGFGGLNWPEVRSILKKLCSSANLNLRVCDTFVANVAMNDTNWV